jgi:hypothetical protein
MAHEGKKVRLTCQGRTVDAVVFLGSENRLSLVVCFDAMLDGCPGRMPIYTAADGSTRNLFTTTEVIVEWEDGWQMPMPPPFREEA